MPKACRARSVVRLRSWLDCITLYRWTAPNAGVSQEGPPSAARLSHAFVAILLGGASVVNSFPCGCLPAGTAEQAQDWFQRHNQDQSRLGGGRQFVGPGHIRRGQVFACCDLHPRRQRASVAGAESARSPSFPLAWVEHLIGAPKHVPQTRPFVVAHSSALRPRRQRVHAEDGLGSRKAGGQTSGPREQGRSRAAPHFLLAPRYARRTGASDPGARWSQELGTTQRYMRLSPAALDAAIRLLEPSRMSKRMETFWRREGAIGGCFELEELKWGG
jgi:hypothetical protein